MKRLLILAFFFYRVCDHTCLHAQGYQAIHGSPYAGSTSIRNNPAASINSAYKWDLTLFTAQAKVSSNTMELSNDTFRITDGYSSRYIHNNTDVSLLNFSYKLNEKKAISFNLRARSYNHMKSSPINMQYDNLYTASDFFRMNRTTAFLDGFATSSSWLEGDLNYAAVLSESGTSRLSGGVTLQIMKGLSGGFARINKLTFTEVKNSTDTSYAITGGGGSFGYSANFDGGGFLKNTLTSLGLSIGVEYLLYNHERDENSNPSLNYSWKIGVAIMDIGRNTFKPSGYSSQFDGLKSNITDTLINNKFAGVSDGQGLRDSLTTVFNNVLAIANNFSINNPTRLVINVDRPLGNNFYLNGDLSLNFSSTSSYARLNTRELNLLTITPRWETLAWGAYLPIQYNTQGQLWVGAALKMGPLLVGVHNIQWIKKVSNISGGGYIMLSIHPFSKRKVSSRLDCPA